MASLVPPDTQAQLACAQAVLGRHLGESIAGIHLFGSAVGPGLRPFSDLDLLVTVRRPPAEAARNALLTALLAVSAPPGTAQHLRALEVTVVAHGEVVPWRYPPRRELQFGEWLRTDLQAARFEAPCFDHDLALLLAQVRADGVSLAGPAAPQLFDPVPHGDLLRALKDTVAQWNEPADWAGDERNVVLALARCWYTAATGRIVSKDAAAAWLAQRVEAAQRRLLQSARAAYLGEAPDEVAADPAAVVAFVRRARRAVEGLAGA